MNDIYLSLANSTFGKNVFEALNLPKPPVLERDASNSLQAPRGAIMLAAAKGSQYTKALCQNLDQEGITLYTPVLTEDHALRFASLPALKSGNTIQSINQGARSKRQYKALVLDASGCDGLDDLSALYTFFQPLVKRIKPHGRIVIVTQEQDRQDPVAHAIAEGVVGFVKSLSKEVGKKGICCNVLSIEKASERQLTAPLYFLLGAKSAYVTGQVVKLKKSRNLSRKINWEKPLQGKTIMVTGAAQGIGRETAVTLARDGAKVIALDIPGNSSKTKALAAEIDGHALNLDLSEAQAAEEILETIASQLGGIDGIVHNAGITRDKTLANMPEHFWDQVMRINFQRIVEINRLLLEREALNAQAKLVCIASISGIAGNFGQTNYAFSKAAIAAYVEALAPHLKNGITINAIAPGFIETEMTKHIPWMMREVGRRSNSLSQGGQALDVAEAVSLFCHPGGSALNGNVLRVCGQSLLGR